MLTVTYGGWSPTDLRKLAVGQRYIDTCPWYDEYEAQLRAPAGTYAVETFYHLGPETFERQLELLLQQKPGWKPAPIAVAITALLVELEFGKDLPCGVVRAAEILPKDGQLMFSVTDRRIVIQSRTVHHAGPMPQYLSICRNVA
jgi:hypothetical protein